MNLSVQEEESENVNLPFIRNAALSSMGFMDSRLNFHAWTCSFLSVPVTLRI